MGSRGLFPGNITSAKLDRAGFKGRNALIAKNLYEFPCHRTFTPFTETFDSDMRMNDFFVGGDGDFRRQPRTDYTLREKDSRHTCARLR